MDHRRSEAALLATLNDLLQFEYDALPSYTIAIGALRDPALADTLRAFRGDHEEHARQLTDMIRERGGTPLCLPHLPTGLFKMAVQAAGVPGGDGAVLLAFKANEWQAKTKYGRHAAGDYPPEVVEVLRRFARDEEKHYAWVCDVLEARGLGSRSVTGAAVGAFARFHGTFAEMLESLGRFGLEALSRRRDAA